MPSESTLVTGHSVQISRINNYPTLTYDFSLKKKEKTAIRIV
jgi:hypothetical protein